MADFDERSGIVSCPTPWGLWYQTLDEVSIEVNVDKSVKSRDIKINCKNNSLTVIISGVQLFSGELFNTVKAKGTLWTLETNKDGKLLRVVLQKHVTIISNTWQSLLKGEYEADDWLLDHMRTKAALEKMQLENPGFDFSGAEVTGNYATGGPDSVM